MTITPQVSVVMPVYNGEAFVESAVDSVLRQEGLLEVLLHDDGSTDGTFELLLRMSRTDARLSLSQGTNCGAAAARNRCLDRARGELVAFLDHDDLWPADRLSRQIDMLAADPSADAVLGHTLMFEKLGEDGAPLQGPRSRRILCGLLQAALFRKRALEPLGGFDADLPAADDFDWLLRFVERGSKVKIDADIAVYYRLHQEQWTADGRFASMHTVRALHKSLQRRRQTGTAFPEWRS